MAHSVRKFVDRAIRIGLPIAIVAAGVAAFFVLGRQRNPQARPVPKDTAAPVETAVAQLHEGAFDIDVDGVVVPFREIQLAAQVEGRIVFKAPECRAGQYVPGDTLLLRIDPSDYRLEVDRLEQDLRQAQVSLAELDKEVENTRALLDLAERQQQLQHDELQRQRKLRKRGVVSDSELDQTQRAALQTDNGVVLLKNQLNLLATRRARLESVQAQVAVQLKEAQLRLDRTEIRTPKDIDVVIIDEQVEEGDFVRIGNPLVIVEDTTRVEVKCQLRMDQLCWLWCQVPDEGGPKAFSPALAYQVPETPATVMFEVDGVRCYWKGRLWRYDGIGVDQTTRMVPCRVVVDQPRKVRVESTTGDSYRSGPPALVRGMYVTVRLHAQPAVRLLDIPEASIQPGDWVWQFVPLEHGTPPEESNKTGAHAVTGTLRRVDLRVVDVVEQHKLFVVSPDGELLIDGDRVQVHDGQVVRTNTEGAPTVLESGLYVIDGGQRHLVDGRQYKIAGGLPLRCGPEGDVPLHVDQVVLPFPGNVVRRIVRTAIVYVPGNSLSPGDRVVVTPIAATKGMTVKEQSAR